MPPGLAASLATILAAALLAPATASAQQSGPCIRLEGENAPGVIEALGHSARFERGRVAAIILRMPNGRDSTALFSPVREVPGRSMRLITFPRDTQPPSFTAVFNLATVAPDGTVLVETWVRGTDRPPEEPPLHNWYRLRCDGTAGTVGGSGLGPRK